eukprot:2110122-Amphidinium_carterae.1
MTTQGRKQTKTDSQYQRNYLNRSHQLFQTPRLRQQHQLNGTTVHQINHHLIQHEEHQSFQHHHHGSTTTWLTSTSGESLETLPEPTLPTTAPTTELAETTEQTTTTPPPVPQLPTQHVRRRLTTKTTPANNELVSTIDTKTQEFYTYLRMRTRKRNSYHLTT